jgi:hypothetical protein
VLGVNGGGDIANVLSVAGAFPAPFMGGYSPAKAAAVPVQHYPVRAGRSGHRGDRADRRVGRYPDGRAVPARGGRTGIVAVDVHATDREHGTGQQGMLCHTMINFI